VPEHLRQSVVTVAKSGTADVKSLTEALELVSAEGTIRVLDNSEYDEGLVIDNKDRWRGVSLVAEQSAVLKASNSGSVLLIHETPEVTVRGFHLKVPNDQYGIEVTGDCPGLLLEKLLVDIIPASSGGTHAALYIHAGASGTEQQRIIVRDLTVNDRIVGVVAGSQFRTDPMKPVKWIVLEDSKICGKADQDCTLCVLFGGIEHVTIRRSLFAFGGCAFSVAPGGGDAVHSLRAITVSNCTLYSLSTWLRWTSDLSQAERMEFSNNLIANSGFTGFPENATSDHYAWFTNNWSDNSGAVASPSAGMLTRTLSSIPFLSTDVSNPDFLKPDMTKLQQYVQPGLTVPGAHSPAAQ
jgi:hypothetical protein